MGNSSQVIVRTATDSADIVHVRGLMREYGQHLANSPGGAASICLKDFESELKGLPDPYGAPGTLLLAWAEGRPAGCVALKELHLIESEGMPRANLALEIKRLWVEQKFRGLGLGRTLMQAAIDYARTAEAAAVYLDTVSAAMPEANRLYEAFGFEQVDRYNDNPVEDVVFFKLPLRSGG